MSGRDGSGVPVFGPREGPRDGSGVPRIPARTETDPSAPSTTEHTSDQLRNSDRAILTRRMSKLEERIAEGEKQGRTGLSYDRQELAALRRLLSEKS